jgi:hypothetical protein
MSGLMLVMFVDVIFRIGSAPYRGVLSGMGFALSSKMLILVGLVVAGLVAVA